MQQVQQVQMPVLSSPQARSCRGSGPGGGSLWSQARRVKVLLFMAFWTHVGLTDQQCCQATRGFAAFGHCFGVSLRIIVVDLDPT